MPAEPLGEPPGLAAGPPAVMEVIRGLGLGGAETLLLQRLRARHAGPGQAAIVLNVAPRLDHYEEDLKAAGIDVHSTTSSSVPRGIYETYRIARRMSAADVVITHSPAAALGFKLAKAAGTGFTLVDVLHSTTYRWPYRVLGRLLNRYADLGIGVSTEVLSSVTARGYSETTVVLGGVDSAAMMHWVRSTPSAPADYRAALGIDAQALLMVNVGNLHPWKNQSLLVDAVARIAAGVHLVIAGEGPERAALEDRALALGVSDRVHLLGSVPDAWKWIAVADVMVHPSHYEGLPVVIMEALALGTPVIATQFGGISDVESHGGPVRVTSRDDPDLIAEHVQEQLGAVETIERAWLERAAHQSFWDVERYEAEFTATVFDVHYRVSTRSNP